MLGREGAADMGDELAPHEEFRTFFGAYVLGALDDDDRCRDLEAHLGACGTCREEMWKLADVAIRLAAEKEEPRPDLWERIRDRTTRHHDLE